jgi:hypothetical protein
LGLPAVIYARLLGQQQSVIYWTESQKSVIGSAQVSTYLDKRNQFQKMESA